MREEKMKTIEELKRLNELITNNKIGKTKYLWGGADVAVVKEQPKKNSNSFYPDTFFVVSEKFSFEISWMFEQLKAVFIPQNWIKNKRSINAVQAAITNYVNFLPTMNKQMSDSLKNGTKLGLVDFSYRLQAD